MRAPLLLALFPAIAQAANPNTTVTDTYLDRTKIDRAASSAWTVTSGQVVQTGAFNPGDGADGACVIATSVDLASASCSGRATADMATYRLAAVSLAAGDRDIPLTATPAGLAVGDEIVLAVIQRFSGSSTTQIGTYETGRILSISGTTVTLKTGLSRAYDASAHSIVLQRVPNYTTVAVTAGTPTVGGWGTAGSGIFAARATGTIAITGGTLSVTGKGFRSVTTPDRVYSAGFVGESPTNTFQFLKQKDSVGGGGGGGDAEAVYFGNGGGGGGYGTAGANGAATSSGSNWYLPTNGAAATGGAVYGSASLATMYLGASGGSGGRDGDNPGEGGNGGAGGGIIWLTADTIQVNAPAYLDALGSAGLTCGNVTNDETGGGGGGAGGSIRLEGRSVTSSSSRIRATGGNGGAACNGNAGGNGGSGRIAIATVGTSTASTTPAANLTSNVPYGVSVVQSVNLLSTNARVGSIDSIGFTLPTLPAGGSARVQISNNGTTWVSTSGVANGYTSLASGAQTFDISALDWFGASFYYRVELTGAAVAVAMDQADLKICQSLVSDPDSDGDSRADLCEVDDDNDGKLDGADNCPSVANPDQADLDADNIGDLCDTDRDGDFVLDVNDNCIDVKNSDQVNSDKDAPGDACDTNDDNDQWLDGEDNCPLQKNDDQANLDQDSFGDVCDPDVDGDGKLAADDCDDHNKLISKAVQYYFDTDGDGYGGPLGDTACQLTPPSGLVANNNDNCPEDPNPSQGDLDADLLGDACDLDDDGDLVLDQTDNCPLVPNPDQMDSDGNHIGDLCDDDDDGDGISNGVDNCPSVDNFDQGDYDNDEIGDLCDPDIDNDDVPNAADCDSFDESVGELETGYADIDRDGFGDTEEPVAVCGDLADDQSFESGDNCPEIANEDQLNLDDDAEGDVCDDDDDNDNVDDNEDNCPRLANPDQADTDGDDIGDACQSGASDEDNDGINDDDDNCPVDANPDQNDLDGDEIGDRCDADRDGDEIEATVDCDDGDAEVGEGVLMSLDLDGDGLGDDSSGESLICGDAPRGLTATAGDNCPEVANPDQADADGDGIGDACSDAERLPGEGCACDQSPTRLPWVAVATLLFWRRRRSR